MQASLLRQIRGGGEEQEEIAVWDGLDDQESGFFFCGVSASGFSCGEEESDCDDNLDGETKKEKMNLSSDDDSAPWTENGFGGGPGEVTGLWHGLYDASQSDETLK
jgi:hypothetical protein